MKRQTMDFIIILILIVGFIFLCDAGCHPAPNVFINSGDEVVGIQPINGDKICPELGGICTKKKYPEQFKVLLEDYKEHPEKYNKIYAGISCGCR